MSPPWQYALLFTSGAGIIAEIVSLTLADKLSAFMKDPKEQTLGPRILKFLGVLSVVYIVGIGILLFSPDQVFRVYGWVLIGLGLLGWLLRSFVGHIKALIVLDGIVCLIVLIDVFRTVMGRVL